MTEASKTPPPLPGAPGPEKPDEEKRYPKTTFWSFVGAYVIARRKKDDKHQKAMRNFRWTFLSGFATVFCYVMFKWITGYVDRQQAAAEARDAAFVTAMADLTTKTGQVGDNVSALATQISNMRSLAIGAKKLPDCPPCVCPKLPAIPACPQPPAVIVTTNPAGPPEPPPKAPPPTAGSWRKREP